MSVATSTAIALAVGGAGAAANIYGAKKGAAAAKQAAQIQTASVDKAQQFNQQAWEAQQKALNPYQQAGQYSLAALMARQYGGSAASYMLPQGYGPPQGPMPPQMQQPFAPGPQGPRPVGSGMTPAAAANGGPPPMSLAAIQALQQNRGTPRGMMQPFNPPRIAGVI